MQFQYAMIAPEPQLLRWVNTFYVIEIEAGQAAETIPAYSAQLLVLVRGQLTITYDDGSVGRSDTVTINAPQLKAAPCVMDGPVTLIGASFTPLGWQAFTNRPADETHDQMIPPETLLTPDQLATLIDGAAACRDGVIAPADLAAHLGAVIAAARFSPRPDHVAVVEAITAWLASGFDPPLSDLRAAIDVSPRQLQRIGRRYFGVPPAQALKRSRAIRAAMLLANQALPDQLRLEMLTSYFDQAHLIHDIRRYTGRTPRQLQGETLTSGFLDPVGHGDAAALMRATQV